MKPRLAFLLLLPLLTGQPVAQTRPQAKIKGVAPEQRYISSYMRRVALLYQDEVSKLLSTHAAKDFDAAQTHERAIKELEQSISITLNSDPCAVDCASTKAFVAAHADQSFFNLLQTTKSLGNVMSLRFGYDGSEEWRISSPSTLTENDNRLFKQFFSCKAVVDSAIETGALILNDGCTSKNK
jgi:hypothetical protein